MQTKTRNTILALSFALMAILASALPVAAQSSHYLRMENNSGATIYELYFSPASSGSSGRDMLGSGTFPDGNAFTITQIAPGRYDLKFVNAGGSCVVSDVPIYGNRAWGLTLDWFIDNCD